MKLTCILILLFVLGTRAASFAQAGKLNLNLKNGTLVEALKQIEDQSEYYFYYNNDEVRNVNSISIKADNSKIEDILKELLSGTGLTYKVMDRFIVVKKSEDFLTAQQSQQQKTVSGKVTDSSGSSLPGVSVVIKGTTQGTITDAQGNYSIINISSGATLVFSFVGMKSQEIKVTDKQGINIQMEEETVGLDEVVAIGYGTIKKSSLTGSTGIIDAKKIEAFPSINIADAFQGKTAGVYVNPSTEPGGDVIIRVRGSRSLEATNDPLVIIDDVPGDLTNLNSSDIESIEVLKDASATAIYGSRASNGVILVTTKKASKMGMAVELNSYTGFNHYNFLKMQSKDEYVNFIKNIVYAQAYGYTNASLWKESTITTQDALGIWSSDIAESYAAGNNFNWQSMMLDDVSMQTGHSISANMRGPRSSSRISYNYMHDKGYYKTNSYNKHILSYYYNYEATQWLKFGLDSRLTVKKNDLAPSDLWEFMKRMNPLENPYNDDGSLKETVGLEQYLNPLWTYEDGYFIDKKNTKSADVILKANVSITSKLTYNTNLKLGFGDGNRSWYYDGLSMPMLGGNSQAGIRNTETFDYTWNNIVTYINDFGKHHFNITAVSELQLDKTEYSEMIGESIPLKELEYYSMETATDNLILNSDYSKSTLSSLLGRVQYEYNGKYLSSFAIRADGSSRLAEGNKWAYFPSGAFAWRMSEEPFMKNINWLSNLKLRVSYGEVGNQGIDPYQTQTLLTSGTYSWGDTGLFTWAPGTIANKELSWEKSKTTNIGIDLGLWENRISGVIELYKTKNKDLLLQRTLAGITGISSIWDNIGSTENKGFELMVSSHIINSGDFKWNVNVNLSRNWNKIVSLPNGDNIDNGWFIGKPINVCYDYKYKGIWQIEELDEAKKYGRSPGEIKVWDNGDFSIDDDDKVILGQRDPKWMGSLISNFSYKNFDFSFVVNAMWGHLISIEQFGDAEYNGTKWELSAMSDMWTPINTDAYYPRPQQSSQDNNESSSLIYMKGDHVKLQDVSVGYTFKNIVRGLDKARIYLEAKNAFYLYRACVHERSGANQVQPEVVIQNADDDVNKSVEKTLPTSFVFGINLIF